MQPEIPIAVELKSLYNPLMRGGSPRGSENECGYRYPHTVEEAETDLRTKVLFFASLSLLSGRSFSLTVEHILDLRPLYFTVERDGDRDWDKPLAPHEILRLTEPDIRYRYARTNHFGTDSLAQKSGGQEGIPVYRRSAREADAKKRRVEVEALLAPYGAVIREEERFSPRAEEERFETPRFLRAPLKTVRGWVYGYTVQTARFRVDPSAAGEFLSSREKFWIKSMERHAFLDEVAREMAEMLVSAAGSDPADRASGPVKLILTDEGIGFGAWPAGKSEQPSVRYYPKGSALEDPCEPAVPWPFKAYGMSSLPEPKLRAFFLASLLSRVLPLTADGGRLWSVAGIDLSKKLSGSRTAAEISLRPATAPARD